MRQIIHPKYLDEIESGQIILLGQAGPSIMLLRVDMSFTAQELKKDQISRLFVNRLKLSKLEKCLR